MLIVVVEDKESQKVVDTILKSAQTGNFGDGKVFVSQVKEAYTIRTAKNKL